jgi:hypothetical protein
MQKQSRNYMTPRIYRKLNIIHSDHRELFSNSNFQISTECLYSSFHKVSKQLLLALSLYLHYRNIGSFVIYDVDLFDSYIISNYSKFHNCKYVMLDGDTGISCQRYLYPFYSIPC